MRIDSSSIAQLADPKVKGRDTASSSSATKSAAGAVVVDLSAAASASGSSGLSAEIASRLDQVSAMIADGSYDPDFARLAERIADDELARAG